MLLFSSRNRFQCIGQPPPPPRPPISALGLGPPIQHLSTPGAKAQEEGPVTQSTVERSPPLPILLGTPRAAMHPPQWIAAWVLLLHGMSEGWEVGWACQGTTVPGTPLREPGRPQRGGSRGVSQQPKPQLWVQEGWVCPKEARGVLLIQPRWAGGRAAERGSSYLPDTRDELWGGDG